MQFHLGSLFFLTESLSNRLYFRYENIQVLDLYWSIYFLLYSLFEILMLVFQQHICSFKISSFFIPSNSKVILLLTRLPKDAAMVRIGLPQDDKCDVSSGTTKKKREGFHDNFNFLCNLKRYIFVQAHSQRLIFILKPCGSSTEELFKKFLQCVFAWLICSQCQLLISCCNQATSQKNGIGMRALEICL